MTVDTKTVSGRRTVHYSTYDDILADAERLAAGPVKTVGNWSYGQILEHLATSFNSSIDGIPMKPPIAIALIARWFMKKRFLTKPLPSGYKIPPDSESHFLPAESAEVEAGIGALRAALERCKTESKRCKHPLLGNLTLDEWEQWGARHAEMHMSFVLPAES